MPPSNMTLKQLCFLSPDGDSSLIHAPLFATLIETSPRTNSKDWHDSADCVEGGREADDEAIEKCYVGFLGERD